MPSATDVVITKLDYSRTMEELSQKAVHETFSAVDQVRNHISRAWTLVLSMRRLEFLVPTSSHFLPVPLPV